MQSVNPATEPYREFHLKLVRGDIAEMPGGPGEFVRILTQPNRNTTSWSVDGSLRPLRIIGWDTLVLTIRR